MADSVPATGVAETFRRQRSRHRAEMAQGITSIVATLVVVLAVVALVTARPVVPGSGGGPAAPIVVAFGAPSLSQVSCGSGGSVYAERIPWISTAVPITSGDFVPKVIELFDGDIVNDPGAAPNVTASNVCAGAAPNGTARWYAVFSDPTGANVLSYAIAPGWAGVAGGSANLAIQNDSSLTIVMPASLAGGGYGLHIVGYTSGSAILGSVTL
jgi:hypothetical protein